MRNKSVWERVCGLTETVVEDVEFDDDSGRDRRVSAPDGACSWPLWSSVGDGHRAMTTAKDGVGGERWTWARRACSSKPGRLECVAANMG